MSTLSSLISALVAAANGEVLPTLISPHDFVTILANISSYNVKPLFPLRQRTQFYATLKSHLTVSGLSIMIPLTPITTFKAYTVHPFPHTYNNSFYTLQVQHTLILKDTHGQAIAYPPADFLTSCIRTSPRQFVCESSPLALDYDSPSCSRALVTNHNIASRCGFAALKSSPRPFVLSLHASTILYFFIPTAATVTCEKQKPDELIQGTFFLPASCQMKALSLFIPASQSYVTKANLSPNLPTPLLINLPTFNVSIPHLQNEYSPAVPTDFLGPLPALHATYLYPAYFTLAGVLSVFCAFAACFCIVYRQIARKNAAITHSQAEHIPIRHFPVVNQL